MPRALGLHCLPEGGNLFGKAANPGSRPLAPPCGTLSWSMTLLAREEVGGGDGPLWELCLSAALQVLPEVHISNSPSSFRNTVFLFSNF